MVSRQSDANQSYNASAWGSVSITKSDATVFSQSIRALYVGTTGDVAVRMLDGSTPVFAAVPAGTLLPIQIDQVLSTGTSAGSMVGLY